MTITRVSAIGPWGNNADMIGTLFDMGYIADDTLDISYGKGNFWKVRRPLRLVTSDINPNKGEHSHDVMKVPPPEWLEAFGTVVWDGDYRLNGTPDLGAFDEAYGTDIPRTVEERMQVLRSGVRCGWMCVRPGGTLLVKCQDQVVSGAVRWQSIELMRHAEDYGMRLRDRAIFQAASTRPQPEGRKVRHLSHASYSTLLVLQKPPFTHWPPFER